MEFRETTRTDPRLNYDAAPFIALAAGAGEQERCGAGDLPERSRMHARIRSPRAHSFSNQFLRAGLSEIAMTSIP